MAIYARHKESGRYISDNGTAFRLTDYPAEATDIKEIADILQESGDFEILIFREG